MPGVCTNLIACYQARVIEPVDRAIAKDLPRSREYRTGMLDGFASLDLRAALPPLRYQLGTAHADAYFAGVDAGHALWRRLHEQANPSSHIQSTTHQEQP
jgi:hypothetical protein